MQSISISTLDELNWTEVRKSLQAKALLFIFVTDSGKTNFSTGQCSNVSDSIVSIIEFSGNITVSNCLH